MSGLRYWISQIEKRPQPWARGSLLALHSQGRGWAVAANWAVVEVAKFAAEAKFVEVAKWAAVAEAIPMLMDASPRSRH